MVASQSKHVPHLARECRHKRTLHAASARTCDSIFLEGLRSYCLKHWGRVGCALANGVGSKLCRKRCRQGCAIFKTAPTHHWDGWQ